MPAAVSEVQSSQAMFLFAALLEHMQQDELPVEQLSATHVRVRHDDIGVSMEVSDHTLRITVQAPDESNLYFLKENAAAHLAMLDSAEAGRMSWSTARIGEAAGDQMPVDDSSAGLDGLPVNLHPARVIETCRPIGGVIRLVLRSYRADQFVHGGLHVKLLLPPAANRQRPDAILWPTVASNGRTRWPAGHDALQVRYYTLRHVDPAARRLTIDVVEHGGGQVAEWASTAAVDDTIGLMGPIGGEAPSMGDHALIAGDMTALPAMASIVSAMQPDSSASIIVEAHSRQDALHYFGEPMEGRRCQLTVLSPQRFADDIASVIAGESRPTAAWFAGESANARVLARQFKDVWQLPRAHRAAITYWRRDQVNDAASLRHGG